MGLRSGDFEGHKMILSLIRYKVNFFFSKDTKQSRYIQNKYLNQSELGLCPFKIKIIQILFLPWSRHTFEIQKGTISRPPYTNISQS